MGMGKIGTMMTMIGPMTSQRYFATFNHSNTNFFQKEVNRPVAKPTVVTRSAVVAKKPVATATEKYLDSEASVSESSSSESEEDEEEYEFSGGESSAESSAESSDE